MHTVKILLTEFVTHDVKRFIIEKPEGYQFTPGQATEVAIDKDGLRDEKRPFTFTSLNEDEVLEFIIKRYPAREGVTDKLHQLEAGDTLHIDDPWGTIEYKGPGTFIAGGAGITPFIAIFREEFKQNNLGESFLIFSNRKEEDVIIEKELKELFSPENLQLVLTREDEISTEYTSGYVDKEYLESTIDDFSQHFYVCGPPKMVQDIKQHLSELGADTTSLVFEE